MVQCGFGYSESSKVNIMFTHKSEPQPYHIIWVNVLRHKHKILVVRSPGSDMILTSPTRLEDRKTYIITFLYLALEYFEHIYANVDSHTILFQLV